MDFPHEKREARTHGRCPGNGLTCMPLSRDPIATEGEATPGPDDYNPYDEHAARRELPEPRLEENPTAGDDPFVFDDVGEVVMEFELPGLESDGPEWPL